MVATAFRVTGGVLILWVAFCFLGRILVHVPSQFDPDELAGRILFHP
jgi:hypothetical protein